MDRRGKAEVRCKIELSREMPEATKAHPIKRKIEIRSCRDSFGQLPISTGPTATPIEEKENITDNLTRPSLEKSQRPYKNQSYAYNQLHRNFTRACSQLHCQGQINKDQLFQLLCCMQFAHSDSLQDRQISQKLFSFVSNGDKPANLDEVLEFLSIISNIKCTKKTSDSLHQLFSEDDKKQIRKQFVKLHLNRIAAEPQSEAPRSVCTFKPKILSSSKSMALKKRSRVLEQLGESKEKSVDVASYLMANGRLSQNKINQKKVERDSLETEGCTFHPKINKSETMKTEESSVSEIHKDRCIQLFQKSKDQLDKRKSKRPTLEDIQDRQFQECTFKPVSTKHRSSRCVIPVKNQELSVERLKEGHQLRTMMNTIKERGYPQQISNWNSFVKCYKKRTTTQQPTKTDRKRSNSKWHPELKTPILSMDIKLINETETVKIFDGDSIEGLTCKLLVRHELPYELKEKVTKLIEEALRGCAALIVYDGFIYEKR